MQKKDLRNIFQKSVAAMIGGIMAVVMSVGNPISVPVDTQVSAKSTRVIYSGFYDRTSWTIDSAGLLVVKGSGNVVSAEREDSLPDWITYADEIKKARIEVKGATNLSRLFYECHNLQSVDFGKSDTSRVKDMSYMFYGCIGLKNLKCNFDTSKAENMSCMFFGSQHLTKLDISKFNTSNVTKMSGMFGCCYDLKIIKTPKKTGEKTAKLPSGVVWLNRKNKIYTSLEKNANKTITLKMSDKARKITLNTTGKTLYVGKTVNLNIKTIIPSRASKAVIWKTSNKKIATVTTGGKVTAKKVGTAIITAVSKKNKKVKAVCRITVKKKAVTPVTTVPPVGGDITRSGAYGNTTWTIDKNEHLEVKGTGDMYPKEENEYGILETEPQWLDYKSEIKSAGIEVTGATTLIDMFYNCENLTSVDLSRLDISNVRDTSSMFYGCKSLADIDLSVFNTSKVWYMENMFYGCESLTGIDLSSFDIRYVWHMDNMFERCSNLTIIQTPKKSGNEVPELYCSSDDYVWKDDNGKTYTELPKNAAKSMKLMLGK